MKEFDVTVTEKLQLVVTVEAESREQAEQLVADQWRAGEHILEADNFIGVEFEADEGREISESIASDTMNVLIVSPGEYPRMENIGTGLESLQNVVGGYIQAIYPFDDQVALICNEEGKINGLPLNRSIRDEDGTVVDIIAGTFLVCGLGDENFTSLPKELQEKYEDKFHQPEAFLKMGSRIMAFTTEPDKHSTVKDKSSLRVEM